MILFSSQTVNSLPFSNVWFKICAPDKIGKQMFVLYKLYL